MLGLSDTSIADTLTFFNDKGIDISFLVPTHTGLEKSIMDAHSILRGFLENKNIHNYRIQKPGEKSILQAIFITSDDAINTKISCYRPNTKNGDPRVWIYDLKKFAVPNNLIGIIKFKNSLFVINCSDEASIQFAFSENGPLNIGGEIFLYNENYVVSDLLNKIKKISDKGYIESVTEGDTGIGMTLESQLGIIANSSAEPDIMGIELKATRKKTIGRKNRLTLFSKAPNWKISPVKNSTNLINKRGYLDSNGRKALYHTLNGKQPNSLNLQLQIDYIHDQLHQVHLNSNIKEIDTAWELSSLRKSLTIKHPKTFWVKADSKVIDGKEHFHYTNITYTRSPKIENLELLIEDGVITLDYTMHIKPTGGVRDHGYLFKILENNFTALFPEPKLFDLTDLKK